MEPITPDLRPKEWAVQALAFWEQQGKGRLQLARKLGISDRSLARWAVGERTPDLENVARTFFHLYAEGCFDDLRQAVDLAWLMGLTAQSLSTPLRKSTPSFDSIAIAGILGPGGARCVVRNPSIPSS